MLDGVKDPSPLLVTDKPATVRVATIRDEAEVFALLWNHLHADNDMGLGKSEQKVWDYVNATCRGEKGICGVIDGPHGAIIGSIGIVAFQTWYSDVWALGETWTFVHPDHRKGTRHGESLFDFARWHRADMSHRLGYDIGLEISVLSFKRLAAKERLWSKHARKVGATFWIDGEHHGW